MQQIILFLEIRVIDIGQLRVVTVSGTLDWKSVQIFNLNILIILDNLLENKTSKIFRNKSQFHK